LTSSVGDESEPVQAMMRKVIALFFMKKNFSTGSVPFRKAYLQSLVSRIEVDHDKVRIKGSKDLLEKAVLAGQNGPSGCSQASTRWRA
jgi:site-specific DNA recombinase